MRIRKVFLLGLFSTAALGFGFGAGFLPRNSSHSRSGAKIVSRIHPERTHPVTDYKSFVIVLYAYNDADWCERSLRSIFSQDYENFRLLLIDDDSSDQTMERVRDFIVASSQQHRVILMQNESFCGFSASLSRAISHCHDFEIVVPLFAKDWMVDSSVLSQWNLAFQNPDVWIAFGNTICYPSYEGRVLMPCREIRKKGWDAFVLQNGSSHAFYSALFKQLSMQNVQSNYLLSLLELSGGRVKNIEALLCFDNMTKRSVGFETKGERTSLKPLPAFPKHFGNESLDAVVSN